MIVLLSISDCLGRENSFARWVVQLSCCWLSFLGCGCNFLSSWNAFVDVGGGEDELLVS